VLSLESSSPSLADLGWDDDWAASLAASPNPSATPGRVARVDLGACTVLTAAGSVRATIHHGQSVATGDWVILTTDDSVRVLDVLPRRTLFRRGAEGGETREQVVAANVDTVLLVNALDVRLSVRRIERYLALAWQSGAAPAVVLSKADTVTPEQLEKAVLATEAVALGCPVHVVSATTGDGMAQLSRHLAPGRTTTLLGTSGAGKSTLVNLLAGAEVAATGEVRSDGKGRHTTTHRELIVLPGRGMLLDTPGMRAISLSGMRPRAWSALSRMSRS
jgi:ribosome biogenesis GTPase